MLAGVASDCEETSDFHIEKPMLVNKAVAVILMKVPSYADFEVFRTQAMNALKLLGKVRADDVLDDDGDRYFVPRRNHANRSENPKLAESVVIHQFDGVYHAGADF